MRQAKAEKTQYVLIDEGKDLT